MPFFFRVWGAITRTASVASQDEDGRQSPSAPAAGRGIKPEKERLDGTRKAGGPVAWVRGRVGDKDCKPADGGIEVVWNQEKRVTAEGLKFLIDVTQTGHYRCFSVLWVENACLAPFLL